MSKRPMKQEVKVTFYKPSGKFYSGGFATVSHFLFESEYKQDIVNTQSVMADGWQGNYYVVVSSDDNAEGFHEALFMPHEFEGITLKI